MKDSATLRERAEALLQERSVADTLPHSDADLTRLVHELQVHQIELEMQNAELVQARADAESLLVAERLAEARLQELNAHLEHRVEQETARNMAQERMMIHQSRLAAMGEMIHNIAHQWRQPLNALALVIGNIKDAYLGQDMTEEYLCSEVEIGQRLIREMSRTIDDFRNFFQPNQEKLRFLVEDSLAEALNLVGHSFRHASIEMVLERTDDPCEVFGFPNEFSQVVLNVLTNAKEAIVTQGVPGSVRITTEASDGKAVVTIRNNGGPIPENILSKVFDPYFTTKQNGTGIGLFMSRMIMEKMGGDISIGNTPDGVEVMIILPLALGLTYPMSNAEMLFYADRLYGLNP